MIWIDIEMVRFLKISKPGFSILGIISRDFRDSEVFSGFRSKLEISVHTEDIWLLITSSTSVIYYSILSRSRTTVLILHEKVHLVNLEFLNDWYCYTEIRF